MDARRATVQRLEGGGAPGNRNGSIDGTQGIA